MIMRFKKKTTNITWGPNVWDFTRLDAAIRMLPILSTKLFGSTKSNPKHFARDVRS
jgi:hypothetical protein